MCHHAAMSPPTYPHAHQIYEYQYFGGLQDPFPVLGRGWDHDWGCCPVTMQEVTLGAKPLGEEEHYLQVKGCISQHPESLDCTSLLPRAISNIGRCSMLSV